MRAIICVLLLISAAWFGALRAKECRQRPLLMLALADSLSLLRNEICIRRAPLPEAIQRCIGSSGKTKCFYRLLLFGLRLDQPFSEVWRKAAQQLAPLPAEEMHSLLSLGEQIGRYDAQTQDIAFASCIEALRSAASKNRLDAKTNARLILGVSITCGLLLVISFY